MGLLSGWGGSNRLRKIWISLQGLQLLMADITNTTFWELNMNSAHDTNKDMTPYNDTAHNVGNAIFPGFNDNGGIMICGYEWGESIKDQSLDENQKAEIKEKAEKVNTFFQKTAIYNSPYDKRIVKWFSYFCCELGGNDGLSDLDKCLLQTNWCDDSGNYVSNYAKFLSTENVENFLKIAAAFRPHVLIFMGIKQIEYLQSPVIKERFLEIFGAEISPVEIVKKPFDGKRFRVGFQKYEGVSIIALPHPSGSRGLKDDYIKLFVPEIKGILDEFKEAMRI